MVCPFLRQTAIRGGITSLKNMTFFGIQRRIWGAMRSDSKLKIRVFPYLFIPGKGTDWNAVGRFPG